MWISHSLVALVTLVSGLRQAPDFNPSASVASQPIATLDGALISKDWIAKHTDNICGLRDCNQISNPAVVDFKACLDATPEMKKARDDKIDLSTPEGIKLANDAVNRVTTACEAVRVANGYCSVWKTIRHKDGRAVADITELVKAQY